MFLRSEVYKKINVVLHITEVCYGMVCMMKYKNRVRLTYLKVTIISSLDRFSPYTIAFLFIVLHMPYFKPTHILSLQFLCFIYSPCISWILSFVFNYQHCVPWYAFGIVLLYNIAMILSNYSSYHVDVKAVLLHAYCTYAMFLRTRRQGKTVADWLVYTLYKYVWKKNTMIYTMISMVNAGYKIFFEMNIFAHWW